ncbi:MAG TPA: PKD domain-containing protein [Candidatus Saccharimonadia bacterium]|jgi:hypothetical protein|nr:PKD domain-containing protein [Candidatus Saccharimonadia bacterium]
MLKIEHTGKIRPRHHTSYAILFFMVVVAAVLLLGASLAAQAAPPAVNPQSGSVGLTGRVNGPPPTTGAVIVNPPSGTHTQVSPITVSGTCPKNTFVTIEKNDVFGGVVACQDDGTFSLLVDLFYGLNTLVARVSDALGQYGPDSLPVTVFYDVAAGTGSVSAGRQMFLESATSVVGTDPNQSLSRTVSIVGGVAPYAVSWDYGDGNTGLSSQATDGAVTGTHTYTRAGTFRVIVRVTDSVGNSALLQLVTVVNGPLSSYGTTGGNGPGALGGFLLAAWPLLVLAFLMVVFFWLGERRELHKLRRRHLVLQ